MRNSFVQGTVSEAKPHPIHKFTCLTVVEQPCSVPLPPYVGQWSVQLLLLALGDKLAGTFFLSVDTRSDVKIGYFNGEDDERPILSPADRRIYRLAWLERPCRQQEIQPGRAC